MTFRTLTLSAFTVVLPLCLHAQEPSETAPTSPAPTVSPSELGTVSETPSSGSKAEAEATAGPRTIVNRFFATLGDGKVDQAYEKLAVGSAIAENTGQLSMLRSKTEQAIEEFGKIAGQELIEMEWAGTHLVRLTYLSLGEQFPLRWRFYFYRTGDAWRLVDIRVDDRLKSLFHEDGESDDAP